MKTPWSREYLWFFLTFIGVSGLFFGAIVYFQIHPLYFSGSAPGGFSGSIILSPILLFLYTVLIALTFAGTGYLVVRSRIRTIALLNRQMAAIDPRRSEIQVLIDTHEPEFLDLQKHINSLLSRMSAAQQQMQSHSGQVGHKLGEHFSAQDRSARGQHRARSGRRNSK
jgi:hypothetical protein